MPELEPQHELLVTSLVASKTGLPHVNIRADSGWEIQIPADQARAVAFNLLAAASIAEEDALLYRFATDKLSATPGQAGQILLLFRRYRAEAEGVDPGEPPARGPSIWLPRT